ncbi:50S ribosomal protein L17 [Candidatus Gottesmanbacteria bacterium]|nr:50S ribosomal protein L17 [Candidatus Gottesmanbacteria bacterium]MBI5452233.1 50S ribosomal protein L17 [Candidatus Gottesmanbacteria bacterium]
MRHRVFGRKLNRDIKERKALFKSLILALINYGKIQTTVAKGKAIHRLAEKMVTNAKSGSASALSSVSSFLARKSAVDKLINEVVPRFKNTLGGYVRMRRLGKRRGDSSEKVVLEWSIEKEQLKKEKNEKEKNVKPKP